jgi:very-short-patch-repair endonuclease
MRAEDGSLDHAIARIAGGQQGNITRAQLLGVGVTAPAITRRVAAGRLHVEFRGVYRVGHRAPSALARYAAAVLACGDGAALSGRAAAFLLKLFRGSPPPPEVTATKNRSIEGIAIHRARTLDERDITTRNGIRCTTVARTLVDLAAVFPLDDLARAHHEARIHDQVHPQTIERVLARRPTSKGRENLLAVIHGDTPALLSRLEKGFVVFLRERGFPIPQINRPQGAHYVDCRWPEHRLTVELDSYRFHSSRHAWEQDYERERAARRRGDEFRRFTWRDVFEDQRDMLAELSELLSQAPATTRRAAAASPAR